MTLNADVLLESSLARQSTLANCDTDKARALIAQVRSVEFGTYKGQYMASTDTVAEFYEVPAATVRTTLNRYRDEFEADGVITLTGDDLREACFSVKRPRFTSIATFWTPKGTLRLGFVLVQSVVAKTIRNLAITLILRSGSNVSTPPDSYAVKLERVKSELLQRILDSNDPKAVTEYAKALSVLERSGVNLKSPALNANLPSFNANDIGVCLKELGYEVTGNPMTFVKASTLRGDIQQWFLVNREGFAPTTPQISTLLLAYLRTHHQGAYQLLAENKQRLGRIDKATRVNERTVKVIHGIRKMR